MIVADRVLLIDYNRLRWGECSKLAQQSFDSSSRQTESAEKPYHSRLAHNTSVRQQAVVLGPLSKGVTREPPPRQVRLSVAKQPRGKLHARTELTFELHG